MLGHESGHERLLPIVVYCSPVHPSGLVTPPSYAGRPLGLCPPFASAAACDHDGIVNVAVEHRADRHIRK
jgi:hypothetical protein